MSNLILPAGEKVSTEVPWKWMLLLEHFAATWGRADGAALGFHCSKCGEDLVARNGVTDRVLRASCRCREYWAAKPAAAA